MTGPSPILVSGRINLETSVQVESLQLHAAPPVGLPFGVHSGPAGIGYNLARARFRNG